MDSAFVALPGPALADAALGAARAAGAAHVDFRLQRVTRQRDEVRDGRLEGSRRTVETGFGVRVLCEGTWGFAAGVELTTDSAARVAALACELARLAGSLRGDAVPVPDEPVPRSAVWLSPYERDPLAVPAADRTGLLQAWSDGLLSAGLHHVEATLEAVRESKFYADSTGGSVTQERVWLHPMVTAVLIDRSGGGFETMRTLGPPAARGWEYVDGTGWDWASDLAALPELLAEKVAAPSVRSGEYDLVIDPTNLWLTIHETVGHATETDRAVGYEAAYAGTSFVRPADLRSLRYGSPLMNVVADRTTPHGLATVGYDDEGVPAGRWHLVRDGVLVGLQADRQNAGAAGLARSNGCSHADSYAHAPMQRMPNVSLEPALDGPDTAGLIGGVDDGVYVVGAKSWSIDMQRNNFQFTGQRFHRIRNGRLAGQLRDVAYQGTTTSFWRSLAAVGGPASFVLCGADMCGKGQPLQIAGVSHGSPSALFERVRVINTAEEGGR